VSDVHIESFKYIRLFVKERFSKNVNIKFRGQKLPKCIFPSVSICIFVKLHRSSMKRRFNLVSTKKRYGERTEEDVLICHKWRGEKPSLLDMRM